MKSMDGTTGRRVSLRECLLQAVLLLVLLAVLFPAVFRGETLLPGGLLFDLAPWKAHRPAEYECVVNETAIEAFLLFHTYYAVTERALEQGEWPLWNPLGFGGMPLLANCQSAVLYPFRLLHSAFDIPVATTVFTLLKLWLCGMTAYACARCFRLGVWAARFVSVGWMLGGYNVIWAYWADPDVAAWLPVMLAAAEFLVEGRYRRGFCAMALSGTLMLLAGHPESAFTMSVGVGGYFVLRLALERPGGRRLAAALAVAAGAWAVVLLVTAVQTLPFLEYLPNSFTFVNRPADEAAKHFMTAGSLVAFWVPRFFGSNADGTFWLDNVQNSNFVSMAFTGVAVWLCLPLVLLHSGRGRTETFRIGALLVPTIVFLLLAFDVPLVRPITRLPVLSATWGCWYMGFPMFGMLLLAGIGMERWMARGRRLREIGWTLPLVLVGGLLVGAFYSIHSGFLETQGTLGYVNVQVLIGALAVAAGLVCFAVHCVWNRPRMLAGALTVVLAVELLAAARGLHSHSPKDELFFDTPLTEFLQELEQPARVNVVSARIPTSLLEVYGIEEQHGYDGILPERMYRFMGSMSGEPWRKMEPLCATRYYLHDPEQEPTFAVDDADSFRLLATLDGIEVYENLRAQPRAFLVDALEAALNRDALFERMRSPEYEPLALVMTEEPPSAAFPKGGEGTAGEASVTERTSLRVSAKVRAEREAVLVVADAYYPGWDVSIDGEAAEGFPAYYAFRGVVVPPGEHMVEWRYRPFSFRAGLWASTVTLVFSAVLAVCMMAKRFKRVQTAHE